MIGRTNFFFLDVGEITLKLYLQQHVTDAINKVKESDPTASEILVVERIPDPDPGKKPKKSSATSKPPNPKKPKKDFPLEGKAPRKFDHLLGIGDEIVQDFGLAHYQEYMTVVDYLNRNGRFQVVPTRGMGDCLFQAIRALISPWKEYTCTHLRRDLVVFICEYYQHFKEDLKLHIKSVYGALRLTPEEYQAKRADRSITPEQIDAYSAPGPYSVVSFLEALATPGFWGDAFTILTIARRFMMRTSVMSCASLRSDHFLFNGPFFSSDCLLLFIKNSHYMSAGMY